MGRVSCSLCDYSSPNIRRVLRHYKFSHVHSFHLSRGIDGCCNKYTNIRSYEKHLKKKHPQVFASETCPVVGQNVSDANVNDDISWEEEVEDVSAEEVEQDLAEEVEQVLAEEDEENYNEFDYVSSIAHLLLEAREDHKMSTSSTQFICQELKKNFKFGEGTFYSEN